MANPPCPQEDFTIKYYKSKDHQTQKAKGLSFFASILSLIIHISIFYIFNLSPFTLFNNHIFWFLMSNNLILIIAADYGAFSSSKPKQNLYYEEYHVSSYVPKNQQYDKKCINPKQEQSGEMLQINKHTIEVPERVIEVVAQINVPKKYSEHCNLKKPLLPLEVEESSRTTGEKPIPARIYKRSKSDRPHRINRVVIDENVNRAMKVEAKVLEEENEFTAMTNEELNRRVEEFIQKFNRQIRLQAARNVYQIDEASGFQNFALLPLVFA